MRNTIRLHKRIIGQRYEFMNPLNRNWIEVDGETATLFLRNVVGYDRLPEGPSAGSLPKQVPWYLTSQYNLPPPPKPVELGAS